MLNLQNGKVTLSQMLLPLSITAFVLFVTLAFQFTQIMRDRSAMHEARMQQQKPLDEAMNVEKQLNALAIGTQKLADKGDKGAKAIIEKMNKLGIQVNVNAPGMPPAAKGAKGMPPGRAPMGAAPTRPAAPPPSEEMPQ